jgi:hypothetical protein
MLIENYDNIIARIQNKSLKWNEYFSLARELNFVLDSEIEYKKQIARTLLFILLITGQAFLLSIKNYIQILLLNVDFFLI